MYCIAQGTLKDTVMTTGERNLKKSGYRCLCNQYSAVQQKPMQYCISTIL